MDNRVFQVGASATPPIPPAAPSIGYPTNGNPVTLTPATQPGEFWFHQIGEELRAILIAAGVVPSTGNNAQVVEAIQRLIDAQSGNYALDTGEANAYVVAINPAIIAYGDGMTVRFKTLNANTGAATLNAGAGVLPLVNNVGAALVAGDLTDGVIITAVFDLATNKFIITSVVQSQSAAALQALLATASGSALVGFLPSGIGAIPTNVQAVLRDAAVSVKRFGAIGDGVTDDTAAIQAAIDYAKTFNGEVFLPAGSYKITGLSINGAIKLSGVDTSTTGSRLFIVADAPAINITAACTIDGIAIIGEGNALKTNQHGVKITSISDVYLRNVFFDNCYNCVHIFGEVFYSYLDGCRWYRSVNTMIYAEGNTAPGFAIQILNCQATPPSGNRGFWFKNFGSVIIDSLMMSPNNLTNEGVFFDTPAASAGISQINNTVIEGSDGPALKMVGASGVAQAKFLFSSNSYFGCGSVQPAISLINTRGCYFSNCYMTGAGSAVTLTGTVSSVHFTDTDFQVLSVPIIADALSVISGLYFTNPDYQGANVFVDLNAASSRQNVSVIGGVIGSHSNPIQPSDMGGLLARLPGVTKYNNGGTHTFNGGVTLFAIAHGLVSLPIKFYALPNSLAAGVAEIREVTVDASNIYVQCKAAATAGTNNVKWVWGAEI